MCKQGRWCLLLHKGFRGGMSIFVEKKLWRNITPLVWYINRFSSLWHLEYRFLKFVLWSCDWPEPGESWCPWQIGWVNRIVFLIIYTFQYTIFIKWFVSKVWCVFVVSIQYKISVFRLILLSGFVNFISQICFKVLNCQHVALLFPGCNTIIILLFSKNYCSFYIWHEITVQLLSRK